ncbi:MAG: hypothetical protein AAGI90_07010, partial [Chlamydiota bacterium]
EIVHPTPIVMRERNRSVAIKKVPLITSTFREDNWGLTTKKSQISVQAAPKSDHSRQNVIAEKARNPNSIEKIKRKFAALDKMVSECLDIINRTMKNPVFTGKTCANLVHKAGYVAREAEHLNMIVLQSSLTPDQKKTLSIHLPTIAGNARSINSTDNPTKETLSAFKHKFQSMHKLIPSMTTLSGTFKNISETTRANMLVRGAQSTARTLNASGVQALAEAERAEEKLRAANIHKQPAPKLERKNEDKTLSKQGNHLPDAEKAASLVKSPLKQLLSTREVVKSILNLGGGEAERAEEKLRAANIHKQPAPKLERKK